MKKFKLPVPADGFEGDSLVVNIIEDKVCEAVYVRHCVNEQARCLEIEAEEAAHGWSALGEWALQNGDARIWSAAMAFAEVQNVYRLTVYYTA